MARLACSFDGQANLYDARAGLPAGVGEAVARSVVERAGAGAGDLLVEIGAGTGELGAQFARLAVGYVGLDRSAPLLGVFQAKAGDRRPSLVLADCDRSWPLRDGIAAVVFASRVVHLLDADHVAREVRRVCRPSGHVILGRVLRDRDEVKERLRRRRQELLAAAGVVVRQGEDGTRRVVEGCLTAGGEALGRRVVAEWTGVTSPARVMAEWEAIARMGPVAVDPTTRARIIAELRRWAATEFGDLHRPQGFAERYVVDVVRLP